MLRKLTREEKIKIHERLRREAARPTQAELDKQRALDQDTRRVSLVDGGTQILPVRTGE